MPTDRPAAMTSRERFAAAAQANGWTSTNANEWLATWRKGRRAVEVQFTVGGPTDRPVTASARNSRRSWHWAGRHHSGPLVGWVLAELTR